MISPKITGALFDFCAYLTSLESPIRVGSSVEVPPLMEHLQTWCDKRGLDLTEVDVSHWYEEPGQSYLGLATTEQLLYEVLARLDLAGMATYRTVDEPDRILRVDPTRLTLPETDITVRGQNNDRWMPIDIIHLDRDSLLAWLRSRGATSPWAEQTVMILLGHDGV